MKTCVFIDIWFVKQDIQKWLKTKTCTFLWRIWKWTEKGQKKLTFRSGDSNPRFSVIFLTMIWIFMDGEGDEIKSKQASTRDVTLLTLVKGLKMCWRSIWMVPHTLNRFLPARPLPAPSQDCRRQDFLGLSYSQTCRYWSTAPWARKIKKRFRNLRVKKDKQSENQKMLLGPRISLSKRLSFYTLTSSRVQYV